MKLFQIYLFILFAISSNEGDKFLTALEQEVVREINLARQNPKAYAKFIEQLTPYYVGKQIRRPGKIAIITEEGVGAAEEAIRFLRSVKPVSALKSSKGMSLGARDHVEDQGPTGATGHEGRDGSQVWDRVNRYGTWQQLIGENISYGRDTAREIVIGLIIDDGVPGRGHRTSIFNSDFKVIGVAYGYHATFGSMCVMTFAGGYKEKKGNR